MFLVNTIIMPKIKTKIEDEQEVPLDAIVTDLKYPFDNASGINAASTNDAIPALNECTLKLVKIERNDEGFTFQWQVKIRVSTEL
jgi:hypothetical protein